MVIDKGHFNVVWELQLGKKLRGPFHYWRASHLAHSLIMECPKTIGDIKSFSELNGVRLNIKACAPGRETLL